MSSKGLKKIKVLVNASTCIIGGGIQVAVSFIIESINNDNYDYLYAVSEPVFNNLKKSIQTKKNIKLVTPSPSKLIAGIKPRERILKMENYFKPDIVFSVFGPSYIKFSGKHLCGFADGWVTHMSRIAYNSLTLSQKIMILLTSLYKKKSLSSKDYYLVETEVSKRGLTKLLKLEKKNIRVIKNTYSSIYLKSLRYSRSKTKKNNINILTISAAYSHKNLKIIPSIAKTLLDKDKINNYKFYVTLPKGKMNKIVNQFWEKVNELSVGSMIHNLGVLKTHECPYWYSQSDIVFLPTLLETSSAVYPEAMIMNKPIITTDLDFAHASCGDASLYYKPLSVKSASNAIMKLSLNAKLRDGLILKGQKQLKSFPRPHEKHKLINNYIKEIIGRV